MRQKNGITMVLSNKGWVVCVQLTLYKPPFGSVVGTIVFTVRRERAGRGEGQGSGCASASARSGQSDCA